MRAPNRLFQIRPATLNDMERLCEFATEFLHKMQARATGKEARQVFQYVIKRSDVGIVVVAEHKTDICAYAYAAYQWRSEAGGQMMDLVEIFVEQSWRNKGVAASLIAALMDVAKERGIRRISAQVHPGNAVIERMLETSGFDPEHRTLWALDL
jgi:GNAT superfamily N-acetyltransferase